MESVFLFQDGVYHFSKGMPLWLENRFQDSEMEPFVFAMGGGGFERLYSFWNYGYPESF